MSARTVLGLLMGGLSFVAGTSACKTRAAPAAQAHLTSVVVIPVEGMSCVSCAATIKKTLASMPGVGDVEVSLGERWARVRFDSTRVSSERLAAAINDLGYHAGTPKDAGP